LNLIQWVFYQDMSQNVDTFNNSEKLLESFVDYQNYLYMLLQE